MPRQFWGNVGGGGLGAKCGHEAHSRVRPHLKATKAVASGQPGTKRPLILDIGPRQDKAKHRLERQRPGWRRLPAGLEARGDGGNLVELVEERRGRRLLKKLLSSPHLRDSTRVVFPDPEWPNSFSLILGCRFWVGRSCWMKSPR